MRNNIYGKAKQGLGIALVIDGQQFPAAWKPAAINQDNETVDVTHAQTENQKAEVAAELGSAMTVNGEFFFDPQLAVLMQMMTTAGRGQERDIYIMLPKSSTPQGITHENGFFHFPSGSIGVGTVNPDLEAAMTADFLVAGGIENSEIEHQQVKTSNVSTALVVTPASNLSTASILKDDVLATYTATGGDQFGPNIFFDLVDGSGTAVADGDVYLEGKFLKAGVDGAGGAGALDIDVSVGSWRGYTEETGGSILAAQTADITIVS